MLIVWQDKLFRFLRSGRIGGWMAGPCNGVVESHIGTELCSPKTFRMTC